MTPDSFFFQPKLTINQPNDIYEQEADAIADKVMRMPSNKNENTFFKPANISSLQRKCTHCEEEEKLQMKSEGNAGSGIEAPSIVHDVINKGGQPLDTGTRNFFESRFGHDFSNVRIHNDSMSAQSAQSINALAYTTGDNIVFNQNQYAPGTDAGKKLLAHELTHVVQQNTTIRTRKIQRTIGDGHDLKATRFAGDLKLEACFDNEARISEGDTGESVVKIQQTLLELGYDLGNARVDGIYGKKTGNAIRQFKIDQNLTPNTYTDVGPKTLAKLDEILSKGGGGGGDLRYCPGIYTTFKSNEATLSDSTNAKTLFDFSKIPYPVGNMADFCKRMRKEYQAQVYFDLLNVILTPQLNKLSILNMIKFLPVSEIAKAVNLIEERNIEKIASSPEGLEVVNALQAKLPKGHERDMVDLALDARSNSPTSIPKSKASPSDISALDRINRVVRNDPHFSAYTAGKNIPGKLDSFVPLHFPVELYSPGRADDGGVYYDPNLTDAGLVRIERIRFKIAGQTTRAQAPVLFIQLGPSALSLSDAYLQSILWHEFQHYKRGSSFRQPEDIKSSDIKALEQEIDTTPQDQKMESSETEATSIQLATYFDSLNDEDVKAVLRYLSQFINSALPPFKQEAIDRIQRIVIGKPVKKVRLLTLIDTLKAKDQRVKLKVLRDAVAKG